MLLIALSDVLSLLILMKSSLPIFCLLVSWAFDVVFKNLLPNPRSGRHTPVLSSKSFVAFPLTFRSLIYFVFLFVYGMIQEVIAHFCLFVFILKGVLQILFFILVFTLAGVWPSPTLACLNFCFGVFSFETGSL